MENDSDDEQEPQLVPDPTLPTKRVPVTILTGFLGSGKTTLLNYILSEPHGKRIAVIENEFSGGLGIEGMIAKSGLSGDSLDGFYELNNGCICCSIKDDLLTTLEQLVSHKDRFDYIIIETTGVANPGPVITSLWTDDGLETTLKLDGVVCVVDSVNIASYLTTSDIANDVRMKISYADRILMNKSDLVAEEYLSTVQTQVQEINNLATVVRTSFAHIDLSWVLDIDCYSTHKPDASLEFDMKQGLITGELCVPCEVPLTMKKGTKSNTTGTHTNTSIRDNAPIVLAALANKHSAASLSSCSISFPGELDLVKVSAFLDDILFGNGARIGGGFRYTGNKPSTIPPPVLPTVYLLDNDDSAANGNGQSSTIATQSNEMVFFTSAPKPPANTISVTSATTVEETTNGNGKVITSSDSTTTNIHGMEENPNDMRIYRVKGILQTQQDNYLQVCSIVRYAFSHSFFSSPSSTF